MPLITGVGELKSYSHYDLFDIFSTPLRFDILNSSIVRVLPRYNDKFKGLDWISNKSRFAYDAFEKQRLLSYYTLVKTDSNNLVYLPINLSVVLKKLAEDFKSKNTFNFDILIGNFFDLSTLSILKSFLVLLGPYRIFIPNMPKTFNYDLRFFLSYFRRK